MVSVHFSARLWLKKQMELGFERFRDVFEFGFTALAVLTDALQYRHSGCKLFLPVSDSLANEVRGILALFDSNVSDPVNIGNPTEYTMLELAALVCEVTGARPDFAFKDLPIGDPTRRQPDITRARELLGWAPTIELREGLERTHAWYLEERARGRA